MDENDKDQHHTMKGGIRALSVLLILLAIRAGAQPVQLSVGSDSACAAGYVEVPVTASHFTGVAGFTLLIRFDTAAAGFDSVLWVHPLLDDTTLWGLHPFMDSVLSITWINFSNGSGINLPHGDTLFWLRFFLKAGSTALEVVLSPISAAYPDYSEFLNASVVALPLNASNGSLSLLSPPPILVEPQPAEVCLGDTAFFSVQSPQATAFQWQSAPLPGGPWTAVGAGTSGGQTAQLQVTGSAPAWYRCIVSAECSDTSHSAQLSLYAFPVPVLSVDTTIVAGQQAYLSAGGGVTYHWSHGAMTAQDTVTPLLTTTYAVTVTDGNGCSAAGSGVVVVQNLPTVTLTLGNAVGCADTVLVPVIAQGLDSVAAMSLIIQIDTSQLNIASSLAMAMSGINPQFANPSGVYSGSIIAGIFNVQWFSSSLSPVSFLNDTLFYLVLNGSFGAAALNWDTNLTVVGPDPATTNPLILNNGSVTIHPRPLPPLVSGDTICEGEVPHLTASGADTLRWYYPGPFGAWVNTGTTFSPAGLAPGVYSYEVLGTDINGCISDPSFALLLVHPSPVVNAGQDTTVFFNKPASLHASLSGGTAPFIREWTPQNLIAFSNQGSAQTLLLSNSAYFTHIVIDSAGCSAADTMLVSVVGGLVNIDTIIPSTTVICRGDSILIDLVVSGGSGAYFYEYMPFGWVPNPDPYQEDQTIYPDSSGWLYITVIDDSNWSNWAVDSLWITVNQSPERFEIEEDALVCPGSAGAPLWLDDSEIGVMYSLYRNGVYAGTSLFGNGDSLHFGWWSQAGDYSVFATDTSNGCSAWMLDTATLVIGVQPAAQILSPGDTAVCIGSSVQYTALTAPGWTYQWIRVGNPTIILGGGGASLNAGLPPGIYNISVIVTNTDGCSDTSVSVRLQVNAMPIISLQTPANLCEDAQVLINGQGAGTGSMSYTWTGNGTPFISPYTSLTPQFQGAPAGNYQLILTGTDSVGCADADTVQFIVNPNPQLVSGPATTVPYGTAVNLFTSSIPSANVGFLWSPAPLVNNPNITNPVTIPLTDTTLFSVNAWDSISGCAAVDTFTINVIGASLQIDSVVVAYDSVCRGDTNTLTAYVFGGSGGYSYQWSANALQQGGMSTQIPASLLPGPVPYSLTVTDTITLEQVSLSGTFQKYPQPLVQFGQGNVCEGDTVEFQVVHTAFSPGPYQYAWTGPGGFSGSGNPLQIPNATIWMAGTYTVLMTDANGCRDDFFNTLLVRDTPTVSLSGDTLVCPNQAANLLATGGNQYLWSTGQTGSLVTVNPTDTTQYEVTVTALNGCTSAGSIYVYTLPGIVSYVDTSFCEGDSVLIHGTWYSQSGSYLDSSVTAAGCDSIISVSLTMHPLPLGLGLPSYVNLSLPPWVCATDTAIIALIKSQPGVAYYLVDTLTMNVIAGPQVGSGADLYYSIPPAQLDGHFQFLAVDTSTGCERVLDSIMILNVIQPDVSITPGDTSVCLGEIIQLTAGGAQSYVWNTTPSSTVNPLQINVLGDQSYSVTGTLFGCVDSARISITALYPDSVIIRDTICQGDNLFFGGQNLGLSGTYYDYLLNAQGCDSIVQLDLHVEPLPWGLGLLSLSHPDTLCENEDAQVLLGNTQVDKNYTLFDAISGTTYSSPQPGTGGILTFTIPQGSTGSLYGIEAIDTLSGCMQPLDTLISFTVISLPVISIIPSDTSICEGDSIVLQASGGQQYAWNTNPPQYLPLTTVVAQGIQTYTVTVTRFGCSDSASVTISSLPVYRDTLNDTICEGEVVSFGGSFLTQGGIYSDTLTSVFGCDSTTTLILIVDPLPYGLAGPTGPSANCPLFMSDPRDAKVYPLVQIGSQCWMVTGLKYGQQRTPAQGQQNNGIAEMYCYDNIVANCNFYGGLYTWDEAMAYAPGVPQGICPPGWHIPTDEEWKVLEGSADALYPVGSPVWNNTNFRGSDAGRNMKTSTGWSSGGLGTNQSGFTSYASGQFFGSSYIEQGTNAWYWSSTQGSGSGAGTAWVRNLRNTEDRVNRTTSAKTRGHTVRCLRDLSLIPPMALKLDYTDTLCPYDTGVIWLSNSQPGIQYTLYQQGTATVYGTPQYGNGDTLVFTIPPALTSLSYEILATDTGSACDRLLDSVIVFTVNPLPQPVIWPDTAIVLCDGSPVTLIAGGGTSYQWTGGPATSDWTVSPSATTIYHVVVTSQGCTAVDSVTVNVNPLPLAQSGPDTVLCIGDSVQLFSSGGTAYQWSPANGLSSAGIANPVAQPLTTTTYVVTVTALGCSAADTLSVTIDTLPLPQTTPDTVICAGTSINLSTSGGQTYLWSTVPSQNQATVTVSPAVQTLYYVTVTSGACSVTDSIRVDVTALPLVSAGADTAVCAGDTALLSGSGGGTYLWGPAASLSNPALPDPLAFPATTTVYTLTVTANGCSASDAVSVQIIPLPPANAGPDIAICDGDSTQLTASGGSSYAWGHGPLTASTWVAPTTTTLYTVTVTSGQCSANDQVQVSWKPLPLASAGPDDTLCSGDTISLSASGGGTYLWTPAAGLSSNTSPNALAYPLATTSYQLLVTLNGCTATDSLTLTVLPLPVANAGSDTSICAGDTAWLTATGGSSYAWNTLPPSNTASIGVHPVLTTTYVVTVNDGNCSSTDAVTVTVNPPPQLVLSQDTAICAGDTAYLTASGASSYTWNTVPPASVATISVAPATATWYTVTASNGTCQALDSVLVTVIPLPQALAGVDTSVCEGDSVRLLASGGTSYVWAPPAGLSAVNVPNPWASPLATQTYHLTVTAQGCQATDSLTITVRPLPQADAGADTAVCPGDTVWLHGSGGDSYAWSPAALLNNSAVASPLAVISNAVTFHLSVSLDGCEAVDSVRVDMLQLPALTLSPAAPGICEGGSVVLNAAGAISYLWSPSAGLNATTGSTVSASPVSTSAYTLVGTNASGCSDSLSFSVEVFPHPQVVAALSDPIICRGDATEIQASGANSYLWIPNFGLNTDTGELVQAAPAWSTVYTLIGSSAQGCSDTLDIPITVIPRPIVNLGPDRYYCTGDELVLSVPDDTTIRTIQWQDGSGSPYFVVTSPGLYWVYVDNDYCPAGDSLLLYECTELWVPNAFTPNGDMVNDYFEPKASTDLLAYHILIFDRWGEVVFESRDIDFAWDGSFKGMECPNGVYSFVIHYVGRADVPIYREQRKVGSIVLVR